MIIDRWQKVERPGALCSLMGAIYTQMLDFVRCLERRLNFVSITVNYPAILDDLMWMIDDYA